MNKKISFFIFDIFLYILPMLYVIFVPAIKINNVFFTLWDMVLLNVSKVTLTLCIFIYALSIIGIIASMLYFINKSSLFDYIDAGMRVISFLLVGILFIILGRGLENNASIHQLPWVIIIIFSYALLMGSKGVSSLSTSQKKSDSRKINFTLWIRNMSFGILIIGFIAGKWIGLLFAVIVLALFLLFWNKLQKKSRD